jgi:hypothetical protein
MAASLACRSQSAVIHQIQPDGPGSRALVGPLHIFTNSDVRSCLQLNGVDSWRILHVVVVVTVSCHINLTWWQKNNVLQSNHRNLLELWNPWVGLLTLVNAGTDTDLHDVHFFTHAWYKLCAFDLQFTECSLSGFIGPFSQYMFFVMIILPYTNLNGPISGSCYYTVLITILRGVIEWESNACIQQLLPMHSLHSICKQNECMQLFMCVNCVFIVAHDMYTLCEQVTSSSRWLNTVYLPTTLCMWMTLRASLPQHWWRHIFGMGRKHVMVEVLIYVDILFLNK